MRPASLFVAAFVAASAIAVAPAVLAAGIPARTLPDTPQQSGCAADIKTFIGNHAAVTFRVLAVRNPDAPNDAFTAVLTSPSGLPLLTQGEQLLWQHVIPRQFDSEEQRDFFEFLSRYGAWMVALPERNSFQSAQTYQVDIFVNTPTELRTKGALSCYNFEPFQFPRSELPPFEIPRS